MTHVERAVPGATISHISSRLRSFAGLLAATVLLPLVVMLLGLWEQQRGADDWAELESQRLRLTQVVESLEARTPRDGRMDFQMQFRRNGHNYAGPLALSQAREARDEIATLTTVMAWRRTLPLVVMGGAGFAAGLSVLVLLTGSLMGWLGRVSREVLVRGFALMRHVLPAVLAIQVVLGATVFVCAVVFEAAALVQPGIGTGEMKLLGVAGVVVFGSLFAAGSALVGLRHALAAFEPDPLPILGRQVSPVEAPGLWRLVGGLAERLGALKPDTIVVGLNEGFFVSAGPKLLQPGGDRLTGRTLYVPLPYLPLLRTDEIVAIIGHELAHFAGGDTDYSLRFLPIYAGVGRSLDAVAQAGVGRATFGLLGPAVRLGAFVMDQFHHGVRHWSRAREFAADAASAGPTSPDAAARALLRSGAAQSRIAETLAEAADKPGTAPADLVAAALDNAIARGLDDPAAYLEAEQAHPTDTHPTTRARIAALGRDLDGDLLAAAATVAPREALAGLSAYFADPAGLCRAATTDFLSVMRQHHEAFRTHLQATVADVGTDERVLTYTMRGAGIFLLVIGLPIFATAAILSLTGVPGTGERELLLVTASSGALGAFCIGFGIVYLRQGERTSLVLRPESIMAPGLDRPIAWDDIADLDMTLDSGTMVTRLLLMPDSPFPQRTGGGKVKLDAKTRVVTIRAGMSRKMKPQDFADLIGRYRQAAQARRLLAAGTDSTTPLAAGVEAK